MRPARQHRCILPAGHLLLDAAFMPCSVLAHPTPPILTSFRLVRRWRVRRKEAVIVTLALYDRPRGLTVGEVGLPLYRTGARARASVYWPVRDCRSYRQFRPCQAGRAGPHH